jgi:hypothetical protein
VRAHFSSSSNSFVIFVSFVVHALGTDADAPI